MSPDRIRPGSARALREGQAGPQPPEQTPTDAGERDEASEEVFESELVAEAALEGTVVTEQEQHGLGRDGEVGAGEEHDRAADEEPPSFETPEEMEEEAEELLSAPPLSPAQETRLAREAVRAKRPHGWLRRIYYGETRIDFVRRRPIWFSISAAVLLAGLISLSTRGLDLGIEFVGGTAWTVQSHTLTVAQAKTAVENAGLSGEVITVLGSNATKSRTVEVQAKLPKGQTSAQTANEATKVANALAKVAHSSTEKVSVQTVGPSWGSQITHKAVYALVVFFVLIALYISIFFEWRMAFAAILAVLHDILVTVGIYSLTGLEVTPDTVVAFLTILGYSLYDTIVVFDRVRDNLKHLSIRDRLTITDIVNLSMNQTLARSINTSLVAIMPILAVLVLGAQVLGASTLQYFGLALLVGLTTGAYSSLFIASPVVAMLKEREQRFRIVRDRLQSRGNEVWLISPAELAAGQFAETTGGSPRFSARARARQRGGAPGLPPTGPAAATTPPGEAPPSEAGEGRGPRVTEPPAPRRPSSRPAQGRARPAARSKRRGGRR